MHSYLMSSSSRCLSHRLLLNRPSSFLFSLHVPSSTCTRVRYQSSVATLELTSQESVFKHTPHPSSATVYKLSPSSIHPRPFTRTLSSTTTTTTRDAKKSNKQQSVKEVKNATVDTNNAMDATKTPYTTSAHSMKIERADASLTQQALSLLKKQKKFYAIFEIRMRPYFVALNDVIMTQKMNDVKPGDTLVFDRVREIGSEDFLLRGNPYVDPKYFSIKAVVLEHPVSDDIVVEKKRRRGRNRTITNRNHHTALRVSHISIHPE